MLVDHAAAQNMMAQGDVGALDVPRRIVLITPAERPALPALKEAGFTGYLVKPVRAASLAARFAAEDRFEHQADDAAAKMTSGRRGDERQGPFDPGRRGQRDQRAAGARAARRGSAIARRSSATASPPCMPSSLRARPAAPTIWC